VLHTFHVTKDIRTVALIKAIFYHSTIGSAGSLGIGGSWLEKEDICACVVCYQIDVIEDARSNAVAVCVDNQVRVNINNRRSLQRGQLVGVSYG
jgi:hypothetical protein